MNAHFSGFQAESVIIPLVVCDELKGDAVRDVVSIVFEIFDKGGWQAGEISKDVERREC
jgi:hypothetical protein